MNKTSAPFQNDLKLAMTHTGSPYGPSPVWLAGPTDLSLYRDSGNIF